MSTYLVVIGVSFLVGFVCGAFNKQLGSLLGKVFGLLFKKANKELDK